ncbi:hypothetical protein GCM10023149_52470 [Mucilaginibacter gynuensis]|uniref:Lipoprotein n=1 Tax=Mucilaginibacter gynuensis TaxID=1302236 RepID=A0ABP8HKU9_9SPHI
MKKPILLIALLLITSTLFSFTFKDEIKSCYLSFKNANHLKATEAVHLPDPNAKTRTIITETGEVPFVITDAYRIQYNNKYKVEFANIKIEQSSPESYAANKNNLLNSLKFINKNSTGMETTDLIELSYNGYKIYGINRESIDDGSNLGTFVLFPGDNTIVYVYFTNQPKNKRSFKTREEYLDQRNTFLGEYTAHLMNCK